MNTNLPKNPEQVRRYLLPIIRDAVEYAMKKMEEKNKKLMDKYIYHSAFSPTVYQRTGEFGEAWGIDGTAKRSKAGKAISGNHVEMRFGYNPEEVSGISLQDNPNGQIYAHGSPEWGNARDYLADLIYNGNSGPMYGNGPWREKRDVWTALLSEFGEDKFIYWMKRYMNTQGFHFTRSRIV